MKAIFLAVAISGLAVSSGFAQAAVIFQNSASTLIITNDFLTPAGPAGSADAPRVALYYSIAAAQPVADPFNFTGWTLSSPTTPEIVGYPIAGRFVASTQTLDGAVAGSTVWLLVFGWTGGYPDLQSAVNAARQPGSTVMLGGGSAWQQATGDPQSPVAITLGTGGFTGFALGPVPHVAPEPSTFALCGLGGIAAAFFTRRQRSGRL